MKTCKIDAQVHFNIKHGLQMKKADFAHKHYCLSFDISFKMRVAVINSPPTLNGDQRSSTNVTVLSYQISVLD
jgi:hypothetical protein